MVNCNYFISVTVYFAGTEGRGLFLLFTYPRLPTRVWYIDAQSCAELYTLQYWAFAGGQAFTFRIFLLPSLPLSLTEDPAGSVPWDLLESKSLRTLLDDPS